MTTPRVEFLGVLLALVAFVPCARAEPPDQVQPSSGLVGELRRASTAAAESVGEKLDAGHDWLYRKLQHWIEDMDVRFAAPDEAPILVPLSPVRLGLETEFLHEPGGWAFAARPDIEASLSLPNLERRLHLFISNADLQESPAASSLDRGPVRAGLRFLPQSHLDFELGVRAKVWPSVFATAKWKGAYTAGNVHVYPFAKAYVESGLGLGASGGVALEHWTNRWVARSASYANWVRDTDSTDWTQTILAGYARAVIQERRYDRLATGHDLACGAAFLVTVSGDRATRASRYETSVFMKRPLRGGWLYAYVEPVVRWDRDTDWHPDVGIRIGFDALFWGLASRPAEVATYCR